MQGRRRANLSPFTLESVFLVGLSCICAYFMGLVSTYFLIQQQRGSSPRYVPPTAPSTYPSGDVHGVVDTYSTEKQVGDALPKPDLPSGNVFLLALTVADSVDMRSRAILRRSWTKVWHRESLDKMPGRVQQLFGSRSWLTDDMECSEYFRHYFVISQFALIHEAITWEAEIEGDMLLTELYIFASKTLQLLWALRWSLEHVRFRYLVKTEPDTFLYVPTAVWWLRESHEVTRTGYYAGYMLKKAAVVRAHRRPWFVSKFSFNEAQYPNYIDGGCVIMSRDLARTLSSDWMSIVTLEDKHPRQFLHISDIDVGISLYHSAVISKSLIHVYAKWESGLCRDADLVASSRVPDSVLLSTNRSTSFHVCGSGGAG
eukprot:scpid37982/ scgid19672/ UDP-GlcNAc:betaGal beta-1,3-N-acetylglucosaminyltransferase 7